MSDSLFAPALLVYLEGQDRPIEVSLDLTSWSLWGVTVEERHLGEVGEGPETVHEIFSMLIHEGYSPCGVVRVSNFIRLGFPYDSEGAHVHE